jgi:hypothetical protein
MSADRYGNLYWGVKVPAELCSDREIYLYADRVRVEDEALVFLRLKDEEEVVMLMIPAGRWLAVFAASLMDGHPVAVEHWRGEVWDERDAFSGEEEVNAERQQRSRGAAGVARPSAAARWTVLNRDGYTCRACGAKGGENDTVLEVDHIKAVALGGDASVENLQTLCQRCNRGKAARE